MQETNNPIILSSAITEEGLELAYKQMKESVTPLKDEFYAVSKKLNRKKKTYKNLLQMFWKNITIKFYLIKMVTALSKE